jgi:hypothetical protein
MPRDQHNRNPNAAGRQKSCTACVKSKRRCDLQRPSCLRCLRQTLTCTYPPAPRQEYLDSPPVDQEEQTEPGQSEQEAAQNDVVFDFDDALLPSQPGLSLDFDLDAEIENAIALPSSIELMDTDLSMVRSGNIFEEKTFSPLHIPASAYARISYPIERLKEAPAMIVEKNCTLWCHVLLYEDYMPRCLQGICFLLLLGIC